MPEETEPPPAAQLTQMIFGFMVSQAISVAAKLGIADLLEDGPRSTDELARASHADSRALYRLLRALASAGVFAEDADGRFRLTPLAEPLRSDVPDSLRSFSIFFGADWHMNVWGQLAFSVQTGQPAMEHIHHRAHFDYLAATPEHAQVFDQAMSSLSSAISVPIVSAYDFSHFKKIVDVGGGQGFLLAAILAKHPQIQGVLYDAQPVIEHARQLFGSKGVGHRCQCQSGDFFESVPGGGDAYMLKHIIHDWEEERSLKILRNCRQSMTENGKILVVEMVIPEGNAPSTGKFLDLEMLLFLRGYERTEKEYAVLFDKAGFRLARIVPTQTPYSIIEGIRA